MADISLESFEIFLYINVNRKYWRHVPFTWAIFCICVDGSDAIINDPDVIDDKDVLLYDNITKPPLLEDRTSLQRNCALVAVVALSMLWYVQNECSNIIQKVNTQFAFANNVSKRFVESFHHISTLVSYESLRYGLQANAKVIMEAIMEKTKNCQFFISYDNINFYENVRNQRIFNCNALVNYIVGYICFIKIPNNIENPDHSRKD